MPRLALSSIPSTAGGPKEKRRLLAEREATIRALEALESEGGAEGGALDAAGDDKRRRTGEAGGGEQDGSASAGAGGAGDDDEMDLDLYEAPPHCIPIRADVRTYDWASLYSKVQFDVILMDPPWQLAGAQPTRGVAIAYSQLPNQDIEEIPVPRLQENGLIFVWVINSRYSWALSQMRRWGYRFVDDIAWIKRTVNRRLAKGHGFYLQHAKEHCLVGIKGHDPPGFRSNIDSDIIHAERRGQSQKPEELYELIERMVPNGRYLEIFARKNNLRDHWFSLGNEL